MAHLPIPDTEALKKRLEALEEVTPALTSRVGEGRCVRMMGLQDARAMVMMAHIYLDKKEEFSPAASWYHLNYAEYVLRNQVSQFFEEKPVDAEPILAEIAEVKAALLRPYDAAQKSLIMQMTDMQMDLRAKVMDDYATICPSEAILTCSVLERALIALMNPVYEGRDLGVREAADVITDFQFCMNMLKTGLNQFKKNVPDIEAEVRHGFDPAAIEAAGEEAVQEQHLHIRRTEYVMGRLQFGDMAERVLAYLDTFGQKLGTAHDPVAGTLLAKMKDYGKERGR